MSLLLDAANEGKISLKRGGGGLLHGPCKPLRHRWQGPARGGAYDADIVLADLGLEYEIRDEDVLSLIGWSPYAGPQGQGQAPFGPSCAAAPSSRTGMVVGEKGYGKQAPRATYPG